MHLKTQILRLQFIEGREKSRPLCFLAPRSFDQSVDGWHLVRTRGSHHQFKHPIKKGLVTIPGNHNDDLPAGSLTSILKQAGLKK